MTFLDRILEAKQHELAQAKIRVPLAELQRRLADAPPVRSFAGALAGGFGLIAELKKKSPSGGEMRPENVAAAIPAYQESPVVKAISVLTDVTFFGTGLSDLLAVRSQVSQPVLRKDFMLEPYQVYEARVYGADAILLMANVLAAPELQSMFQLAAELGMDVLFEAHTEAEIQAIPQGAKIYGINSRKFKTQWVQKTVKPGESDFSTNLDVFDLVRALPPGVIKVAESGVKPGKVGEVMRLGFDAVLVGASLLQATQGVREVLGEFEAAIRRPGL
jgi:indole-3-glycerol phosphate synthase